VVILLQWVPRSWFYPLFAVAVTLYMIRITMRMILARQERVAREEQKNRSASGQPPITKQTP